jgi:hypothetical protein
MSPLIKETIIEPQAFKEVAAPHSPPSAIEIPTIYYSGSRYAIEANGSYIPLTETAVGQHLRKAGIPKADVGNTLCEIRIRNYVAYMGPVAGYPAGLRISEDTNRPILVTEGPNIVVGAKGDWSFLREYLEDLLGDDDQLDAALCWLRQARKNLIAGKRRPLPAAVLVGPRNCGKSLFIEVARQALGGRAAPAFAALSGASAFNADIIGAELLTIDDEIASKDHRARTALGQGLKKHLFAGSVRAEAKGRDAVPLRPVQAVVIAVNDEPEHLQVLPTLDDSVADKISLFACNRARLNGLDDRDRIGQLIREEMPAFVYYLDNSEHPENLRDNRTGCAAWQHREVVLALQGISPEERMRELMLQCDPIMDAITEEGHWRGTAAELERLLVDGEVTAHAARSLFRNTSTCGTYLGRLMADNRAVIQRSTVNGIARWTIRSLQPPAEGHEGPGG